MEQLKANSKPMNAYIKPNKEPCDYFKDKYKQAIEKMKKHPEKSK